jgi:protein involved in polysaccharide export with SLBB domain
MGWDAMAKYLLWAAVVAIGLQMAGCYAEFGPVVGAENPVERPVVPTRLQAGDRIRVLVYGEENLNGVYDVDPSGFVSLPLAGNVRAAGLTKPELQQIITAKYKSEYLQNPQVTVDFVVFRPVYVMGEVFRAQSIPYHAGLNVISAITDAGGLSYRGSRSTVLIRRAGEDHWVEYAMVPTVMVGPGDILRVPERYF